MKKLYFFLIGILLTLLTQSFTINPDKTLWYTMPAQIWEETLPLGDGRLGMMPDGGVVNEKIVLNEISMWSGSEFDYSNPEASKSLPEIRRLLKEGKNKEAQKLMYEHFVPKLPEFGGTYGNYQMLGDLEISYNYHTSSPIPVEYSRGLDLDKAIAWTQFTLSDGVSYRREYSVARGEEGMLVRLTASKPGKINFSFILSRPERGKTSSPEFGELLLKGELNSGQKEIEGVRYAAEAGVKVKGKHAKIAMEGDSIVIVKGADEAWIGITAATTYFYPENYLRKVAQDLKEILENPEESFKAGVSAHESLMARTDLSFPTNENSFLPTNERLKAFAENDTDTSLAALYYNYGRYLLISSTQPGLLPPNLQGLWANGIGTPWNGDYHTNINVQMNHWPAETGNLSELHLPLAELTLRSVPSGERSAKAFYGPDAQGWVMHMMTNAWNYTEPGEDPSWGATNTGGAWLCEHLWEHYDYTGDKDFLAKYYPVMKGAAMFFYSTMIEEPKNGWLVTAPSSSPENEFYLPGDNTPLSVCMGPTMDTQIIGELWSKVIKAANILEVVDEDIPKLKQAIEKLPPMQVDSQGRLMEWLEEYDEVDPHHRHVSHLYGLYPGYSISVEKTPELIDAARKTLDVRGDEGTGWSRAWKINFHARLLDGNRAWKVLKGLLQPAVDEETGRHRAGTFANLFCSHPPFQIDGNFGGTAGISEMLIQSHDGYINLLPALPDALPEGVLKGFRTRGGNEIDLVWRNRLPEKAKIKGGHKEEIKIKIPGEVKNVKSDEDVDLKMTPDNNIISLNLPEGKIIELEFEY
ncbi:MAG: glycoside hydrolase family 95 protein [Muribaculaceae bacterium]|nr:glycoside hydrolase family 95 protein [Muribaculaceae bacterium]